MPANALTLRTLHKCERCDSHPSVQAPKTKMEIAGTKCVDICAAQPVLCPSCTTHSLHTCLDTKSSNQICHSGELPVCVAPRGEPPKNLNLASRCRRAQSSCRAL